MVLHLGDRFAEFGVEPVDSDAGGFRLLRKSPRKTAVQALRACARPGIVVNESNAWEILEQLIRCKEYETYLSEHAEELKAGFGVDIQSPDGDPKAIWSILQRVRKVKIR